MIVFATRERYSREVGPPESVGEHQHDVRWARRLCNGQVGRGEREQEDPQCRAELESHHRSPIRSSWAAIESCHPPRYDRGAMSQLLR